VTDDQNLAIRDILATPRPVEASFAALFPTPPLATYRVYVTGMGPAAGLHYAATVTADSVGEALDAAIVEAGATEVDGAHYVITVHRQTDGRGSMSA
jgi:hypothetical protein